MAATASRFATGRQSFGLGSMVANPAEEDSSLWENVQLITTFDGPSKRKEFASRLKQVLLGDESPIMTFYTLLNKNPKEKDFHNLDEDRIIRLIKEHNEFCQSLYRFAAFSDDLIHPLHMLIAVGASPKVLRKCLKACEAALYHDTSSGGAPIHYAISHFASFEVVRWLIKKDPDALQMPTPLEQQVPLHIACQNGTDFDTIAFLTFKCGAAALRVDQQGRTALHLACNVDKPKLAIIEDLTEVGPDACGVVANDETPLLVALRRGLPHDIVRDLLVSHPNAAKVPNANGMLPLHIAIAGEMDMEIIRDLIKAYGDGVKTKEPKGGNLPVHVAVRQKCTNMDLYLLLARKYPEGLEEENSTGLTPHEYAKKLRMQEEVVEFLNPFEEVEE